MYECSPNAIVVVLHVTWSSSNFEAGFVVVGFFVHQAAKKEKKATIYGNLAAAFG